MFGGLGLFAKRPGPRATPLSAVDGLRAAVKASHAASNDAKADAKAREDIGRHVTTLKTMLFGSPTAGAAPTPPTEADVRELTAAACTNDLLELLARNLRPMAFETRKDAVQVFNNLLRRGIDGIPSSAAGNTGEGGVAGSSASGSRTMSPEATEDSATTVGDAGEVSASLTSLGTPGESATTVSQVAKNGGDLLTFLVSCYDDTDIALNSGTMLRECLRDETLAGLLLASDKFWTFFTLVEKNDFDVASDAFTSFKDILTHHQSAAAAFIVGNLDRFTTEYNGLLRSENYYTRRQSLKLLGEMLIVRANFMFMTPYINSPENLKLIMTLLLDNRKNIQFEAFHVFKVFVSNPYKTTDVEHILVKNKDRMIIYLTDFQTDRDDDQFQGERRAILGEIEALS